MLVNVVRFAYKFKIQDWMRNLVIKYSTVLFIVCRFERIFSSVNTIKD